MWNSRSFAYSGIALPGILLTASAAAQRFTIDFDDRAAGTAINSQYPGVTFSGRNPEGNASFDPIIYNPSGSTTSEPQCLSAHGAVDFSHEFIRVDFARAQTDVTFTLGVRVGCTAADTMAVRYYEFVAGAYVLRGTFLPNVNGTLPNERVWVFVRVTRPNNLAFHRIEIEGDLAHGCGDRYELIDDLSFDIDTTPPAAGFDPVPACVCNGTSVTGNAYDPDGDISGWQLHRRKRGDVQWVLIRSSTTEIIGGELGPWTTSGSDGEYTLRLRVTNQGGLITESFVDVYMDRALNALAVRSPIAGAILGGTVCVDGTAWDHCGGEFTVEHRTAGGGAWIPFETILPPWVINDPMAYGNTGTAADGNYEIRVSATDDCGNTAVSPIIPVVVDNTPPTAVINSPVNCASVGAVLPITGIVNDAHLLGWSLSYTGGDVNVWTPIPGGNGNVNVNGLLANWDTTGLTPCCYTLRLVATDAASVNCGATQNQREFLVSVELGEGDCLGDLDGDRQVGLADLALLLGSFGTICP